MASALYDRAKQGFMNAELDLDTDDIRELYIDVADYTFSAAHDFLDDVIAGSRVGAAVALAGRSLTNGVFDATDTLHTSVTGDPFEAIILYKHTGVEATSMLIAYIDGLTGTPNGGNITTVYDNGANKIFRF